MWLGTPVLAFTPGTAPTFLATSYWEIVYHIFFSRKRDKVIQCALYTYVYSYVTFVQHLFRWLTFPHFFWCAADYATRECARTHGGGRQNIHGILLLPSAQCLDGARNAARGSTMTEGRRS